MPNSYRDLEPHSQKWEAYANVNACKTEMEAWLYGPILIFDDLRTAEAAVLRQHRIVKYPIPLQWDNFPLTSLWAIFDYAMTTKISYIYFNNLSATTCYILNEVCRRFNAPFRIKDELKDEQGYPLGIRR